MDRKLRNVLIVFAIFIIQAWLSSQTACALRLTELRVPAHAIRGSGALLECHYDLDDELLYSVKWYKDGHEFYRFVPRDSPPVLVFQLPGVTVDLHNSSETGVSLTSLTLSSTGRYRCEVSGEAPSFETVTDHGDMIVVALPEEGPRISGGRPRYQIGDTVKVNCTSGRSKPVANLSWFINGEPADRNFLRGPEVIVTGREGLETAILGLEFNVRPKHFRRGDMKLKCLATIASVYWRSNEESVQGERPQRPPARESVQAPPQSAAAAPPPPPVGSRADRVQAGGGSCVAVSSSLLVVTGTLLVLMTTSRTSYAVHSSKCTVTSKR